MENLKRVMNFDQFMSHFASAEYIIICYILAIYFYFLADITNLKHIMKSTADDGGGGRIGYSYPKSLKDEISRLIETSLGFSWVGFILYIMYWVQSTKKMNHPKWTHSWNFLLFLILFAFNIYIAAYFNVLYKHVPTDFSYSIFAPFAGITEEADASQKAMTASVVIGFIGVGGICVWHWAHSIWGPGE